MQYLLDASGQLWESCFDKFLLVVVDFSERKDFRDTLRLQIFNVKNTDAKKKAKVTHPKFDPS